MDIAHLQRSNHVDRTLENKNKKLMCTICSVWMAVLDEDSNFHRIHRSAEVSFKSCMCKSLLEPMKVFINNVL